jgi:hypothetical protein
MPDDDLKQPGRNRALTIETPVWSDANRRGFGFGLSRTNWILFGIFGLVVATGTVLLTLPKKELPPSDTQTPGSILNSNEPLVPRWTPDPSPATNGLQNRAPVTNRPSNSPVVLDPSADYDDDGVPDRIERREGTNIDDKDTDDDGLTDLEELYQFETDPTLPDTDGDSYPDGTEVRHGYNPLGPG